MVGEANTYECIYCRKNIYIVDAYEHDHDCSHKELSGIGAGLDLIAARKLNERLQHDLDEEKDAKSRSKSHWRSVKRRLTNKLKHVREECEATARRVRENRLKKHEALWQKYIGLSSTLEVLLHTSRVTDDENARMRDALVEWGKWVARNGIDGFDIPAKAVAVAMGCASAAQHIGDAKAGES